MLLALAAIWGLRSVNKGKPTNGKGLGRQCDNIIGIEAATGSL
jgi:hypothetical protein